MSATSSVLLQLLVLSFCNLLTQQSFCSASVISHNINSNHNGGGGGGSGGGSSINDWQRNLEAQMSRLVGRLDQLELRVGRVQSLVQMRFDNIENGMTTTKLRLDLWGDELNRIEESMSRKWKILESKFDIMIGNVDSKLDSKLTAMQRDNRRHNEFLASAFNAVAVSQERLNEKVQSSMIEVNSSLEEMKRSTARNVSQPEPTSSVSTVLVQNSDRMLHILEEFISNSTSQLQQNNARSRSSSSSSLPGGIHEANQNLSLVQYQLLGNKVTNMFEDLMRRSTSMETTLKDAITLTNFTRKDVHDGFRTILASSTGAVQVPSHQHGHHGRNYNSHSHNGGGRSGGGGGISSNSGSSSEVMSAVIVEALASVESMSSALGRRITEFSRSIDEKLEMVSMSIDGFHESCIRIQDGAPLIEDYIADLLMKILDTVDNSTKSASELWQSVAQQILEERREKDERKGDRTESQCPNGINPSSSITSTETITEPEDHEDNNIVLPSRVSSPNSGEPQGGGNDSRLPSRGPDREEDRRSRRRLFFGEEDTDLDLPTVVGRRTPPPPLPTTSSVILAAVRKRPLSGKPTTTTTSTSTTTTTTTAATLLSPEEDEDGDILTEEDKKSLWESYFPQVPE